MTNPEQSPEQPAPEAPSEQSELPAPQALVEHVEKSLPQPGDLVDRAEFSRRDDGDTFHG